MRNGFLGSIAALAAGAAMAFGQAAGPQGAGVARVNDPEVVQAFGGGPPRPVLPPPQLPVAQDGPAPLPAGPNYPPPANFAPIDPDSLPHLAPPVPPGRTAPAFWLSAEYLMWFERSQPFNFPLASTGPPTGQGVVTQPATAALFGVRKQSYNVSNGFRITGGFFCDCDRRVGFEASGFLLERKNLGFSAQSDANGIPLLARPFIDAATGQPSALLVAFPQYAAGRIDINNHSRVWGSDGNVILNLFRSSPYRANGFNLDALYGFRFVELDEDLVIRQQTGLLPGNTAPFGGLLISGPATIGLTDSFRVFNQFYGGQVGLRGEWTRGCYFFNATGKVALGDMHHRVEAVGSSSLASNTVATSVPGGLFSTGNAVGIFTGDKFAVVPELTLNVGVNFTPYVRGFVGYNLLYMTDVIRPADLVNPRVNANLVNASPTFGQAGPAPEPFVLRMRDFWVQGINFGLQFRY